MSLKKIEEHLVKLYGFEKYPCLVAKNYSQSFKRSIYIIIKDRISEKLCNFLMKVSPIKYLDERPDKSIWLEYKTGEKGLIEIQIIPIDPEKAIYTTDTKGIFKPGLNNYKVKIYTDQDAMQDLADDSVQIVKTFPMNLETGIQSIDAHLSDFPMLKTKLRESKLNSILN